MNKIPRFSDFIRTKLEALLHRQGHLAANSIPFRNPLDIAELRAQAKYLLETKSTDFETLEFELKGDEKSIQKVRMHAVKKSWVLFTVLTD